LSAGSSCLVFFSFHDWAVGSFFFPPPLPSDFFFLFFLGEHVVFFLPFFGVGAVTRFVGGRLFPLLVSPFALFLSSFPDKTVPPLVFRVPGGLPFFFVGADCGRLGSFFFRVSM